MAPKRGKTQKEEVQVSLGPQVHEDENVFGVAHIFASFNDTFVHVTDLSGRWEKFEIIVSFVCKIQFGNSLQILNKLVEFLQKIW